ncbi:MAG: CPXCG motif-containing cysteine-rich protein [Methylobacter sp.]|nr:CPXCG motif-containing cysteine-rich protein [Methylobacter sp.]
MQNLEEIIIDCPYCGEALDVLIDSRSGPQRYYEDCAVCCTPILFIVSEDNHGEVIIDIKRDDE